ncbi:MAG TPA: ThuA domain-containing protein, partial [Acidobacteriaceae bacterium]
MNARRILAILALTLCASIAQAEAPIKHVLAFYSTTVEKDHVMFAEDALKFYAEAAEHDHFTFESTTNWDDLNPARLAHVDLILWLDDAPHTEAQRRA